MQMKARSGFQPESFVVTSFREYFHHPDLAAYLAQNCAEISRKQTYLIFGDCNPLLQQNAEAGPVSKRSQ
jgi:hypothetical protein